MNPEEEVVRQLKKAKTSIVFSLPCDRVKTLHNLLAHEFFHVPLTREEEGVGISVGAALAGENSAMLIQSSGLGNMINALSSLTQFYKLPLFLMISWRGVYKEGIEAQKPMGALVPKLLDAMRIEYVEIHELEDLEKIGEYALKAFDDGRVTAALLSPKIWEKSKLEAPQWDMGERVAPQLSFEARVEAAKYTRFEIIRGVKDSLKGKVVVANIGVPCKELYHVFHQPSNFYMLGSLGMATPIGLGIALASQKEVVVIDGDGSILMNPGSLATAAQLNPRNLTILAIDNGVHGSTGNQPTAAREGAHLGVIARGMGIENTLSTVEPEDAIEAMQSGKGPRFIHIIAKPGNAKVANIPLTAQEIKDGVMEFLKR
jgi:sulfopyruvate decarboxylase subunit beta